MDLCQKRDRTILRFESQVADLEQQLKATTTQETTQDRAGDDLSDELRNAQQKIEEQGQSINSLQKSACTMAKLVMAQCPAGLEWPSIMQRIDWNSEVMIALPTQNPWKVRETWSKDPMLAVGGRTESLTALLLEVVASVESRSLVGMVSCLAAIQLRLDEEPGCIFPVMKLFLDAVSACIEHEGVHAFQIFLLLQVAERIGRAWPDAQSVVDELTRRGGAHELTSSVSRSVASWGQRQRMGSLGCETSLEYQDWALVGFFRNPNGILLLGESELRWADHDFFDLVTNGVTVGKGNDEIEFEVKGQNWNCEGNGLPYIKRISTESETRTPLHMDDNERERLTRLFVVSCQTHVISSQQKPANLTALPTTYEIEPICDRRIDDANSQEVFRKTKLLTMSPRSVGPVAAMDK
ncbi:hypothetical protein FMUND_10798 [Fusarium mundagurra]|uniref:Uncharacterized protein n=1 Tax=Fusarium mundagurra TaxID=1567541 RepID=A0A8H5YB80_9HYPO|nr:hypothetical protein FMUND_10798 [Fusarium mundagurra]